MRPQPALARRRKRRRRDRTDVGTSLGIEASDAGDRIDLHVGPRGERHHLDRRSCGPMVSESFGVYRVHRRKVREVRQVYRRADDRVQSSSGGFEDGGQVVQDPLGLSVGRALDEPPRGRVEGDLARGEDPAGLDERLGVGTDRGGSPIRMDLAGAGHGVRGWREVRGVVGAPDPDRNLRPAGEAGQSGEVPEDLGPGARGNPSRIPAALLG